MQGAKNSRVLDPTKFLKITKVGASTGLIQMPRSYQIASLHLGGTVTVFMVKICDLGVF